MDCFGCPVPALGLFVRRVEITSRQLGHYPHSPLDANARRGGDAGGLKKGGRAPRPMGTTPGLCSPQNSSTHSTSRMARPTKNQQNINRQDFPSRNSPLAVVQSRRDSVCSGKYSAGFAGLFPAALSSLAPTFQANRMIPRDASQACKERSKRRQSRPINSRIRRRGLPTGQRPSQINRCPSPSEQLTAVQPQSPASAARTAFAV